MLHSASSCYETTFSTITITHLIAFQINSYLFQLCNRFVAFFVPCVSGFRHSVNFCLFVFYTKAEMSLVLEHGVPPEAIILSGVCKQQAHIKYAAKNNVQHLVCENEAELIKISRLHPNAK